MTAPLCTIVFLHMHTGIINVNIYAEVDIDFELLKLLRPYDNTFMYSLYLFDDVNILAVDLEIDGANIRAMP